MVIGRLRDDPALLPAAVGDGAFDRLDGDRRFLEVERARRLAGRRADAAGELREVVGRLQVAQRLVPIVPVDEVVPVRDLVVHRAAVVTIRDAAIHAARRLVARRLLAERDHELAVMPDAIGRRRILPVAPVDLEKARHLAHSRLRSLPVMAGLGPAIPMRCARRIEIPGSSPGMTPSAAWRHSAATLASSCACSISWRARRYSTGITLTKRWRYSDQLSRISLRPRSSRCRGGGWRSAGAAARRRGPTCWRARRCGP